MKFESINPAAPILDQSVAGDCGELAVGCSDAAGRIERGIEILDREHARMMLVTGVDREVKAGEFAAEFDQLMAQDAALPADLLPRLLANAKAQANKPETKAWKSAMAKLGGATEKEPLDSVEALDSAGKTVLRLLQELSQGKAARENE